jgi:4-aminobutyrate aminotransferase
MINIKTKLPGNKSQHILKKLKRYAGCYCHVYPFIHSHKGKGCYFQDIDNNTFLDFASQIATLPLGYNHPNLLKVLKKYNSTPIKYAGSDFLVEESLNLMEELATITPKGMNADFLVNSGAEAVENCIKIATRSRPNSKFAISFEGSFHGRTTGSLSLTKSKKLYSKNYLKIPTKTLPFNDSAADELKKIIKKSSAKEVGFVILEHVQGEGGYRIASKYMVKTVRKICSHNNIPYIADEVQSGMGRTGKWWAFQNFNITPDIFSTAKALQVGAAVSSGKNFPEPGALGSTWGGGSVLDMAMGLEIIKTIKRNNLLSKNKAHGDYLTRQLAQLDIKNPRNLGLMVAFDLSSHKEQLRIAKSCFKNGLIVLPAGLNSIRLIPPYIVTKREINEAMSVIERVLKAS